MTGTTDRDYLKTNHLLPADPTSPGEPVVTIDDRDPNQPPTVEDRMTELRIAADTHDLIIRLVPSLGDTHAVHRPNTDTDGKGQDMKYTLLGFVEVHDAEDLDGMGGVFLSMVTNQKYGDGLRAIHAGTIREGLCYHKTAEAAILRLVYNSLDNRPVKDKIVRGDSC